MLHNDILDLVLLSVCGGTNGNSAAANTGGGASGCVSRILNSTHSGGTGGAVYIIIAKFA